MGLFKKKKKSTVNEETVKRDDALRDDISKAYDEIMANGVGGEKREETPKQEPQSQGDFETEVFKSKIKNFKEKKTQEALVEVIKMLPGRRFLLPSVSNMKEPFENVNGEMKLKQGAVINPALFTAQDDDTKHDVVRVMTIHTAKGLEFDTVFVPGLVDGQFPSYRLRNEDELEEERRLLYVAMTRAKNMLYLSSYENKDTGYRAKQSVFLGDMDATQLECINGSRIVSSGAGEQMLPKVMFAEGDRVVHKVFGEGTVVTVDRPAQTYDIQFDKLRGTRRIMFRAELEGID